MSSAPDSPGKPRLSGGTPSLSERIAALQRRNVSGPSTSTNVSPSSSSQGNTPGSSLLAPPSGGGGAASAVKDRIARLQSRGDGESPLVPRSSFGAPAPNPDVASHAVRQFPGAGGSQAGLRPQLTGAAWLNGMPAANSAALRPQQTGGMWGNQYYGAHAAHPMPRRGPSPTTPSRQISQPFVHGDAPDAFAELDREAELARLKEAAAADSTGFSPTSPSKLSSRNADVELPSLPTAPESTPPLPVSSPRPEESGSAASTLPELPEAPTETPQVKIEPSPAPPTNGQSHEIEIGVRAPADPEAQRKLEIALVSSTSSLRLEPITPTSPSATQGRKTSSGSSSSHLNNPLYTDITDHDDQLLGGGQGFGTLTVLKRSRTGSSSVSDGVHGVGKAALDSMLMDGSDSEEGSHQPEHQSPSARQRYKRQGSATLDASGILASPKTYGGRNGESGGSISVEAVANGSPIRTDSRDTSRTATRDDHLQSPVRKGSAGTSGLPLSSPTTASNTASAVSGLPASDSVDSAFTITSNPRTIHDSPDRVGEMRRASASTASTASMSQSTNTDGAVSRVSIPRRSASVASSTVSMGSNGGRRAMPAEPPILESSGTGSNSGYGNGERASPTTAASSASAAASRAREAIALARSKSQGGRLAKPPPPGRTLTAAELDASDDDYEPGWASIISRK